MVREDDIVMSFQPAAEMLDGLGESQQLSIVCAVLLLRWVHLFGEECERMPRVVDALL
jgi:hypothetical protein